MQDRVAGGRPRPQPVPSHRPTQRAALEIILGIDPSLRGTGYGIIRVEKRTPRLIAHGTIKCSSDLKRSQCLQKIGSVLRSLVQEHRPTSCVMEGLFYAQNFQTALLMGEARGAALFAVSETGIDIYEIAPRKVKQAIVGYGAAQKEAVARMVQRLLGVEVSFAPDAADALAVALAHAQTASGYGLTDIKRI